MYTSPLSGPRRGLPLWTLGAVLPVVLVFGFVSGLAIATYAGPPSTAPSPAAAPATPPPSTVEANTPTAKAPDSSWTIIVPPTPGQSSLPPATTPAAPTRPAFTGPARDIRDARLALLTDFGRYSIGTGAFTVDYQQMRSVDGSVALVGLLRVQDYPVWSAGLAQDPERLKAWLTAAVARVQGAAASGGFHIAWAVVDVLRDPPSGFAAHEVTPLENRNYLVIRPLAATVDHNATEVSLRPRVPEAAAGPVLEIAPWSTYGPVLRFDTTDLYRPALANDTKPFRR